jgi:hypothetical protein
VNNRRGITTPYTMNLNEGQQGSFCWPPSWSRNTFIQKKTKGALANVSEQLYLLATATALSVRSVLLGTVWS